MPMYTLEQVREEFEKYRTIDELREKVNAISTNVFRDFTSYELVLAQRTSTRDAILDIAEEMAEEAEQYAAQFSAMIDAMTSARGDLP